MGPEGLEPPPPGLKGRCAAVTPQPRASPARGMRLNRRRIGMTLHLHDPHSDKCHRVRAAGFEPAISSSPSLRISQAFPRPVRRSGRMPSGRQKKRPGGRHTGPRDSTKGVRDGPGVNSDWDRADADSPNNRGAVWRPDRSALAVDMRAFIAVPSPWGILGPVRSIATSDDSRPRWPSPSRLVHERRRSRPGCSRTVDIFSRSSGRRALSR